MYLHGAETNRLLIRKLEVADIKIWTSFFEDNPSLEYLGLDLSLNNKKLSRAWIKRQLERYAAKEFGHHALINKETQEFIGQCGLLTQKLEDRKEIEIGYHILPKFWGHGYATEAALKFRDYAFQNKLCNSLISVIDIRNLASQNVAKKIGMHKESQVKYFNLDVYIYRINL